VYNYVPSFTLDNFEGPLELLLYLIQKDEIDICTIAIKNLTSQCLQALEASTEVEISGESLTLAATLLLIKSQKLLPHNQSLFEVVDGDPRLEILQSLIEYCHFKEAAQVLSRREEEQQGHFPRATPIYRKEPGTHLEKVDINNLKNLLDDLLKRTADSPKQMIVEEEWQVSQKLEWIQQALAQKKKMLFTSLFSQTTSRKELIVLFLALLEMMKNQEVQVVKENENLYIISYDRAA